MKKKLYYVIEKELVDIDGVGETTGRKDITTYSVVNSEIEEQFSINVCIDENSIDMIDDYLIDNGMGDDEFEFIQL